jgi:hypothetical protein
MSTDLEWNEVLQEYDRNYHILESAREFYDKFARELYEDMEHDLNGDENMRALFADGLSVEHRVMDDNRFPYLQATVKIQNAIEWFAVVARIATPWARGVCFGKLHIGVKYVLDKKACPSFSKTPSLAAETDDMSLKQFIGSNQIEEKKSDFSEVDEWVYLEELGITESLNRNDLRTQYKNVVKNALKYISQIDSPLKKAYESLLKARDSVKMNPIVKPEQEFEPEENGLSTNWNHPFFQINTSKAEEDSKYPAIWIYVDADERIVCFGLSKEEENGVKFKGLNTRFMSELRKMNSDFKKSYDVDSFECGTLANKESLEENSSDQIAIEIEKALRKYGELVEEMDDCTVMDA